MREARAHHDQRPVVPANEVVKYISDLILRSRALARRLEGWTRVHALCPSFETLASQAPQDEVGILHRLERRDPSTTAVICCRRASASVP